MPRVTVYYFTKYDITAGEVVLSQRPATLETIVLCERKLIEEQLSKWMSLKAKMGTAFIRLREPPVERV